ncbi:MAG: hypothetical protein ACI9BD_001586, partial [Candidatus Marinamargulisbacteria bacterium]
MKFWMSLICCFFAGFVSIHGADSVFAGSVSGYMVPSTFSANNANYTIMGAYSYLGIDQHALDLEYDRIANTESGDDIQSSMIAIYTYYDASRFRPRIGVHRINTAGPNNNGIIGILGASYDYLDKNYYKKWTAGTDVYYSSYDFTASTFSALQLSPHFTTYFYPKIFPGYMAVSAKYHAIFPSDSRGYSQDYFTSFQLGVSYSYYPVTVTLKGWEGESIYGVYKGGILVYN